MGLTLLSNYSAYKICFEDKFCASRKGGIEEVGKGEVSPSLGESTWWLLQLVVEQPWLALGMSVLV